MKTLTLFFTSGYFVNSNRLDLVDLTFVADILTIVVGVLCITSIVIIGFQYLTAPSGSYRIRQSKRHLFEIIAGFTIYATIYALLRWILLVFSN